MSTYVLMKLLESAPERYDRGIRILSWGRIGEVDALIADFAAAPGREVLDIGCGTGRLSLACAARGARVTGIDRDSGMLQVARSKPVPEGGALRLLELGAAEIEDRFEPASFDAVVSCLAFSEMSPSERRYVLRAALGRLRPGGCLAIGDEVQPATAAGRLRHALTRAPLVALTWALTQTTTRALPDIAGLVREAGFSEVHEQRAGSDFAVVLARKAA